MRTSHVDFVRKPGANLRPAGVGCASHVRVPTGLGTWAVGHTPVGRRFARSFRAFCKVHLIVI